MSIQYTVPGFELTTFGTRVSSHNHKTRALFNPDSGKLNEAHFGKRQIIPTLDILISVAYQRQTSLLLSMTVKH